MDCVGRGFVAGDDEDEGVAQDVAFRELGRGVWVFFVCCCCGWVGFFFGRASASNQCAEEVESYVLLRVGGELGLLGLVHLLQKRAPFDVGSVCDLRSLERQPSWSSQLLFSCYVSRDILRTGIGTTSIHIMYLSRVLNVSE